MYLDTNGDGVNTTADVMNANGVATNVSVYLHTDQNADGSPVTCDTGDPVTMTMNSFIVNLQASGGTVTYSNYVNQIPSFTIIARPFTANDTQLTVGNASGTPLPAGFYFLCTLTITGATGAPSVGFIDYTLLGPDPCSFGTACTAQNFDNTYTLGLDWFDIGNLGPAAVGNLNPQIVAPPTVNGSENALVSVTGSASDPDAGQLVTLSQTNNAPFFPASSSNGPSATPSITLSATPNFAQAGGYTINWHAVDNATPTAGTADVATALSIANVDRAPAVTAPPTATVPEGSPLTIIPTAADPDGDAIATFTATGTAITAGATFTANGTHTSGTLSWTPTFTQSGTYAATFTATNALSGSATTNITVTNTDRPPTVTAPATATVNENALLTVNVTASDPDGDAITSLTATGTAITAGATFAAGGGNTSGTLTWTPTFTQAGTYAATFTATNALSGSATTNITVNNVDRAPTVTAPATANGTVGTLLTFTVTAADPDGDTITTLTATGTAITAGATFTSNGTHTSGTFSWTPAASGSFSATFTATNALSGSATTSISIGAGNPPVVTAPATATVNENALLTVNVTATDPDGPAIASLTASGTAITAGATFAAGVGNTSGTLTWTPTFTQAGTYAATFTATNTLSGSATTNITVNNVDRAPTVTAPATATGNEGALLTVNVTANDPDGDAITSLTATGTAITAGATFAAGAGNTSGTLSWTPTFTQAGTYAATFTATNALSGSATTNITINNTDRAPTVTAPATASGAVGILLTFTVSASDPDGDAIASLTASGTAITAGATFTAGAGNTSGTFSWTPAASGSFSATFTATNALSGSATTSISIGAGNPPVVTAPATATVNENSLLTFTVSATDPDGPAIASLTASGTAITAGATFAANGTFTSGTFSWTPTFTQAGTYAATFTATNTLSGSATTNITVNNVDRAPTVTAPATATVNENALLTVNVTANDPDGDAITSLTASGTAVTAGATFAAGGGNTSGTLSWTPTFTQSGTYAATFTATNALSGSATTSITVSNVDRAPVLAAIADLNVAQATTNTTAVSASDADGDVVDLTASLPSFATLEPPTSGAGSVSTTVSASPAISDAVGAYPASVTATALGLTDTQNFSINVSATDQPPVLDPVPNITVDEGATGSAGVSANDPDGDTINLTASLPSFATLQAPTSGAGSVSTNVVATPGFSDSGSYPSSVTATSNTLSDTKNFTIDVNPVDRAPTVTAPATATGSENNPLTVNVSASDPDGDAIASLTASGTAITAGATFTAGAGNTSGTLSWTPGTGQSGSYSATFTATNALTGSATTDITIGVDNPPVVTAPASATVNENDPLTVDVTASDADGDPITSLTATGSAIAAGATFTAGAGNTSGTLQWTPTFTQAGSYAATFTASNALTGSATTDITVENVDRAPSVTAPATESVGDGSNLNFTVSASDPDGDAIASLTAAPLPGSATFTASGDNTSGTFDWTPGTADVGTHNVTFTASNALSGSATTMITVTGVNHDPIVTAPASETTDEGVLLAFGVSATDADGDHVTLTATGVPSGAGFTDNGDDTGSFSWTPGFTQAGSYSVTFHGSDGKGGSGSATTGITVNNVNRAPTADAGGTYNGVLNVAIAFDGSGSSDPDGDVLTFAWDFGDGSSGTGATVSHPYASIGLFNVSLTVTDPGSLSDTDQTTANVVDVFTANAFFIGGNKTTRLASGKPYTCVQIEPVDLSFQITDVDLSSIVLVYGGAQISAAGGKSSVDGDRNGNGVQEIAACFSKEDLRTLFAGLPAGENLVDVSVQGSLVTGGKFSADTQMRVFAKGGPIAVSAAPNPLNPETEITFSIERAGRVRVQVFDLAGRLVNTLSDQARDAGSYTVRWNGTGRNGSHVASGVYFVRVEGLEGRVVMPVTVLK
ncbi:MAG TPA: Ig-like domain-containing protein [Candidatus Eisenbacteria bacterium]